MSGGGALHPPTLCTPVVPSHLFMRVLIHTSLMSIYILLSFQTVIRKVWSRAYIDCQLQIANVVSVHTTVLVLVPISFHTILYFYFLSFCYKTLLLWFNSCCMIRVLQSKAVGSSRFKQVLLYNTVIPNKLTYKPATHAD